MAKRKKKAAKTKPKSMAMVPSMLVAGAEAATVVRAVRAGQSARETARDESRSYYSGFRGDFSAFLRRRQYITDSLDQNGETLATLAKRNPEIFIEFLFDRDPLLSSVLEKFIDLTASQFSVTVTKNGRPHAGGQQYVDEFITKLGRPVGDGYQHANDLRRILRKQLQYLFVRKAVALEVVFDEDMQPVGIPVIDPLSVEFRERPGDRFRYKPYQKAKGGEDVDLDIPNFIWIPHSSWGDPHSRNPLIGAIKKVLGMMQLHQDLELVVHHAAWPRLQIGYELEKLDAMVPETITEEQERIKWMENQIDQIVARYADLQADDNVAFASDLSEVKYLELQHTSGEIFSPESLMKALEVRILDATDTLSTTIGRTAFTGEGANALDGLVQAAVWGALRQTVETATSRALSLALLVGKGIAAKVELSFEEIVLEPRSKLAVWVKQDLENLRSAYLMGGILEEEMAQEARRLTRLMGPVPEGTAIDEDWVRGNKVAGDPNRDPSQEPQKEQRRQESNRGRRSTG